MRTCPSCQHEIAEDALFCGYCGQRSEPAAKRTMLGMAALTPEFLKARLATPEVEEADDSGRKATVLMSTIKPEDIARATNSVEINITPRPAAAKVLPALASEPPIEVGEGRAMTLPIRSPIYNVSVSLPPQKERATLLISGAPSPDIAAMPSPSLISSDGDDHTGDDDLDDAPVAHTQAPREKATIPLTMGGEFQSAAFDMAPIPSPSKATLNLSSALSDTPALVEPAAQKFDLEAASDDTSDHDLQAPTASPTTASPAQSEPVLLGAAAPALDAAEAPEKGERSTLLMATVSSVDAGWDDLDGWPDPESFSVGAEPSGAKDTSADLPSADLPFADTMEGNRAEVLRQIASASDEPSFPTVEDDQPAEAPAPDTDEANWETFEASRQDILDDIAKAEAEIEAESVASPVPPAAPPAPSAAPGLSGLRGTVPAQEAAPSAALMGKAPQEEPAPKAASRRSQPTALIGRDDPPRASKATLIIDDNDLNERKTADRGFSLIKWGIIAATVLLLLGALGVGIAFLIF